MIVSRGRAAFSAFVLVAWLAAPQISHAQRTAAKTDPTWPAKKQAMIKEGLKYKTAWAFYQALKARAKDPKQPPKWTDLPDWSGIYTREASPFYFDPDQKPGQFPTAPLRPAEKKVLMHRLAEEKKGIEYDPISACGTPPGFPRWLAEPFLREFVATPTQTLLINEANDDVRRIYTDGRGHPPKEDQYPLYDGDSIGFWDGHKLVIHTDELKGGIYQRGQPDYSPQAQTVEIWRKVSPRRVDAYVWVYDPKYLTEPWFTRQRYVKLTNEKKDIRIRYWASCENQNNDITETKNGGSTFTKFGFTSGNGKKAGSDEKK